MRALRDHKTAPSEASTSDVSDRQHRHRNQELKRVIEAANNKLLKRFFTLFVKHWKKPKVKK